MANDTLYIIGNGFDRHHQIQSSYEAFGSYVHAVNPDLHQTFETYFSFKGNWANLEDSLAKIDIHSIIADASDYLVSYGDDKWSDDYHHAYQYEIERIVNALSKELKRTFAEWICSLDIPNRATCCVPLIDLKKDAVYLNFNYTNTLHKLYGIAEDNVVYIHNRATSTTSDLVLGHATSPSSRRSLNYGANAEYDDVRVAEGNALLDRYFFETYKPTGSIIAKHAAFFDSLRHIKNIFVIGHSLSEVDMPYLERIAESTSEPRPGWIVTFYSHSSVAKFKAALSSAGIAGSKVKYLKISDLGA